MWCAATAWSMRQRTERAPQQNHEREKDLRAIVYPRHGVKVAGATPRSGEAPWQHSEGKFRSLT